MIINGPNLNLLGLREPEIYGSETMEDCMLRLRRTYTDYELEYFQSNHEGDISEEIHRCAFPDAECAGIILNAGAYTHTSLAIADAIAAVNVPVIEVHISNVAAREAIRHTSLIAPVCRGVIAGFGLDSYRLGIEALLNL